MVRWAGSWLAVGVLVGLVGCGSTPRGAGTGGQSETGVASYYADKYENRQTASGERFRQSRLTAAHRTLPFGTEVRVENLANGKSVVVRINDRGPFVKGRVIDLSRSAFSRIGRTEQGLLDVEVRVVRRIADAGR